MHFLQKIDDAFITFVNWLIIICSVSMSSLIFFLVLSRYFFGSSIIGMLELGTIFAFWLYMLGAIVSSRNKEHLVVDLVEQSITNPKTLAIYEVYRAILVLLTSLFAVYLAYEMLGWALKRPQTTPALGYPLLVQQGPMITATIFFVIYAIRDIVKAMRDLVYQQHKGA